MFRNLDHTGSVSLLVSQEKGTENLKMQKHKFKESQWTKGLTGIKQLGNSYTSQYLAATHITVLVSLLQSNTPNKNLYLWKVSQNMNITRTRQNKNYFSLMLRISYLPRNVMNVLQSHSKKYFFYQATSRARTVLWAKGMGVFSL